MRTVCAALALMLAAAPRLPAELAVDLPTQPADTNAAGWIRVPKPLRGGSSDTNAAAATTPTNAPAEPPARAVPVDTPLGDGLRKLTNAMRECPPTLRRPDATGEELLFSSGDALSGQLVSLQPETISWRHPAAAALLAFRREAVSSVRFAALARKTPPTNATVRVRLAGGDILTGSALTLDGDAARLCTSHSGDLRLPWSAVETVAWEPAVTRLVYAGPNGPEGWRCGDGDVGWTFDGSGLVCTGSGAVARNAHLPDRARVDFTLEWGRTPYVRFAIFHGVYVNKLQGDADTAIYPRLTIEFSRTGCRLIRVDPRPDGGWMPRAEEGVFMLPEFERPGVARISVLAGKPDRAVTLLVDGRLVKQWTDLAPLDGMSTGIAFGGESGDVRISDLRAYEWQGPVSVATGGPAATETAGLVLLNGDVLEGVAERIGATDVLLRGPMGTLTVPLARVARLTVRPPRAAGAGEAPDDRPVASLGSGDRLRIAVSRLDAHELEGESASAGRLVLARAALKSLTFGSVTNTDVVVAGGIVLAGGGAPLRIQIQGGGVAIVQGRRFTRGRPKPEGNEIRLANGDAVSGTLAAVSNDVAYWECPAATAPLPFAVSNTACLRLGVKAGAAQEATPVGSLIRLKNGDQIYGNTVSTDARTLLVQTRFAGAIRLPQSELASVTSDTRPPEKRGVAIEDLVFSMNGAPEPPADEPSLRPAGPANRVRYAGDDGSTLTLWLGHATRDSLVGRTEFGETVNIKTDRPCRLWFGTGEAPAPTPPPAE